MMDIQTRLNAAYRGYVSGKQQSPDSIVFVQVVEDGHLWHITFDDDAATVSVAQNVPKWQFLIEGERREVVMLPQLLHKFRLAELRQAGHSVVVSEMEMEAE